MRMSPEIGELAKALSAAKLEFGHVEKDRKGQVGGGSYRYATLESALRATTAALSAHGLAVSQEVGDLSDLMIRVDTLLLHESGQYLLTTGCAPIEQSVSRSGSRTLSDVQEAGKTSTYLRRYQYCAILGITAEEDDDAALPADSVRANRTQERAPDPDPIDDKGHRASFAGDRARFCAGLKDIGTTYEEVAELCVSLGRPRPSGMTQGQRDGLSAWLRTPDGQAKLETYQHDAAERAAIQEEGQ